MPHQHQFEAPVLETPQSIQPTFVVHFNKGFDRIPVNAALVRNFVPIQTLANPIYRASILLRIATIGFWILSYFAD